jgi:hypothetical protein
LKRRTASPNVEAADLRHFTLVKSNAAGAALEDLERLLDFGERRATRRTMIAKEVK